MSVASPFLERPRTFDSLVERLAHAGHQPVADGYELVTDWAGFEALEADWTDLLERMEGHKNPFLSYNWHWHWCRHYLDDAGRDGPQTLQIVVGRKDGRVTMIWPLVLYRELGLRILRFMGEPVSQYADILVEPGSGDVAALKTCWEHLCGKAKPDALVVRKARHDGAVYPLLTALGAIETAAEEAPFADLSPLTDYSAYETRFSKRFRRNCRRQCNRLEDDGALGFTLVRESDEARGLMAHAFHMKREWLRETGRIAPSFNDERFASFFAGIAGAVDRPAGCVVSALMIDDQPIAVEVGILNAGQYAGHIGAFEARYGRLSPGTHQMARTVAKLIEMDIERYDLLAPSDDYKRSWADGSVGVGDYVVPRSIPGRVYADLYLKRLRPAMKHGLSALSSAASRVTSCL